MREKTRKRKTLNQLTNTPRKGLYKIKNDQLTDNFNVLVIDEIDDKIYEVDKSTFSSSGDGSGLFPKGFKIIQDSDIISNAYEITSDDVGYYLYFATTTPVSVTVNQSSQFNENDIIGIRFSDSDSTFSTGDGVTENLLLYSDNQDSITAIGEVAIFIFADGFFIDIGGLKTDTTDDDKLKSIKRFLYDESQNAYVQFSFFDGITDIEFDEVNGFLRLTKNGVTVEFTGTII